MRVGSEMNGRERDGAVRGSRPGGVPIYRQIASELWDQIQNGQLWPGQQLPSEAELSERYGVTRLTLRQAILELLRLGAVEIRRGIGTFVVEPPDLVEIVATVPSLRQDGDSTHEALRRHAAARAAEAAASPEEPEDWAGSADNPLPTTPLRRVDEKVIEVSAASGPLAEEAAGHLGQPVGEVVRLDTVMVRAGQNWIVNSYWLPERYLDVTDLVGEHGLVVTALQEGHRLELSYQWRAFSAAAADFVEAELLGVQIGAALLVRDGVTGTQDGTPVFYVRRRLRGDEAKFVLKYGTA